MSIAQRTTLTPRTTKSTIWVGKSAGSALVTSSQHSSRVHASLLQLLSDTRGTKPSPHSCMPHASTSSQHSFWVHKMLLQLAGGKAFRANPASHVITSHGPKWSQHSACVHGALMQ